MNRGILGRPGARRPTLRGQLVIGDRTNVIATGLKGQIELPACDIEALRWIGDVSGSITIDLWALPVPAALDTTPTSAHSIMPAANKFVVGSKLGYEDRSLSGYKLRFCEPHVFYPQVDSASTVKQGTLVIFARERE